VKGRPVYISDHLFESILVQAHRRNTTISDYLVGILDRQVPDYRATRGECGKDAAEGRGPGRERSGRPGKVPPQWNQGRTG
jgi:hypothetical protein